MKLKLVRKKPKRIVERKTKNERKKLRDFPIRSLLIGLFLWIAVSYLFYAEGIINHIDLAPGQRIPATIVAAVDFECENLTGTAFSRAQAEGNIPPVFIIDHTKNSITQERIERIFNRLIAYYKVPEEEREPVRNSLNDLLLGTQLNVDELIEIFPDHYLPQAKKTVLTHLSAHLTAGIMPEDYQNTLFLDNDYEKLTVYDGETDESRTRSREEVLSVKELSQLLTEKAVVFMNLPTQNKKRFQALLNVFITENLTYDEQKTTALRNQASKAVEPVVQRYTVGTPLVRAGDQATPQSILLLQTHETARQDQQELKEQMMQIAGNILLLLAGLVIAVIILSIVDPKCIASPSNLLLLAILSLLTLGAARLVLYFAMQYTLLSQSLLLYLVPFGLSVLLAGILLGGRTSICLGLWNSFATAILLGQSFNAFVMGLLITVAAATSAREVHRRSNFFKAGFMICSVKILYVLVSASLFRTDLQVMLHQLYAAVGSAVLSTILALLLIPLFERLFKITTDITLLELSDMGHPLLQKMAMQAPGTYHHSLMVATLAQNAAEKIGANSLLTRVCAYYHDIGKMVKPEFFTENIQHKENPHDELSPHMSALVIVSHVKEGLSLARRHKLPTPVLEAIEQHHGNGLISFFYHKAKTQMKQEGKSTESLNDSDFRYGGHPAVSAEMAILALADTSEAASRSIEKPTPAKIANLIDNIFNAKIKDGQLDYADLTLAQIRQIKDSFVFSLSNMLHGRVAYPKDDEDKPTRPTKKPKPESSGPSASN